MFLITFQGVCLDASHLELDYVQPDEEYVRWVIYSKCSKILNTYLFLVSIKHWFSGLKFTNFLSK